MVQKKNNIHNSLGYYAAIDLGSNTCRLLIAQFHNNTYTVVDSFSRIIRLGSGLKTSGKLSNTAIERALSALQECSRKLRKYNITQHYFVATAACRTASNKDAFLKRVQHETGIHLVIISEAEEAFFALQGCQRILPTDVDYALGFDIGGCSTEILWSQRSSQGNFQLIAWKSIPFGVVSILDGTEGDPLLFYEEIRRKVNMGLTSFSELHTIDQIFATENVCTFGSSGTTTTLAAIHMNLEYYERNRIEGVKIDTATVRNISEKLCRMRPRQRAQHPCIGPHRSDLVLAGLAILEGICDTWDIPDILVADRGVRDGILVTMLEQSTWKNLNQRLTPFFPSQSKDSTWVNPLDS